MKALLLFLIILAGSVSMLIGCAPSNTNPLPTPTNVLVVRNILHTCDERGVCCYEKVYGTGLALSCVATRVEVYISKGEPEKSGEIDGRTIEERVLRNIDAAFRTGSN